MEGEKIKQRGKEREVNREEERLRMIVLERWRQNEERDHW